MSLYKLNELSNELELKEKIKDIRKKKLAYCASRA